MALSTVYEWLIDAGAYARKKYTAHSTYASRQLIFYYHNVNGNNSVSIHLPVCNYLFINHYLHVVGAWMATSSKIIMTFVDLINVHNFITKYDMLTYLWQYETYYLLNVHCIPIVCSFELTPKYYFFGIQKYFLAPKHIFWHPIFLRARINTQSYIFHAKIHFVCLFLRTWIRENT